ncbi:crotonase/enoyl-CoA hydratase family protein [Microbaculum marinisediminis]|uniref:Crotonase/enoyl-CoA hydratase family protein n=1 Tax=Microbaculum marinisediminis TaxID=2931392 RepID=A0AAW5R0G1_9HYPH|nr:crotonase/enoyl-CoA hydratase family protein [Microbaculum sp. A6E488]MCT8972805.1 crotonase/enoyl-CoA hydratase family protein [Microbaculum sp. A6E488]
MSDHIQSRREGHVLVIRIARPDKKNALTVDMYAALADAIAGAEADRDVRAIVLLGSEGSFCAGNDIGDFLSRPPHDEDAPVVRYLRALARSTVPLVAGVDGDAVGIGTTTLLHCDLVFVTARAKLRLPFVNLGLVPEAGSTLLLPRVLGHVRAAELIMLGDPFDGARAVELGIANHVVAPEALEADVMDVAARIAAQPPSAMRESKRLLKGDVAALEARILEEVRIFTAQLSSPEAREAFTAFMEKRKPDFSKIA